MAQNILIAALGEHPAVVTGMVKALREFEEIWIDTLYVLHPQQTGKDIAQLGYPLIEEHLEGICDVCAVPLGFPDANTTERSIEFLRTLAGVLEAYQNEMKYNVYLSLAGGRKNMSTLMAFVGQFYPSVKGLFHLLSNEEENFPSIWQLVDWPRERSLKALEPPFKESDLIPIRYPGAFASASKLRTWLKSLDSELDSPPIALTAEAEQFYREIYQGGPASTQLDLWLSSTAVEQYEQAGTEDADRFWKCFKQMRHPKSLKKGLHHKVPSEERQTLYVYKRGHRQRPFFYTEPNPIEAYPHQLVERVIVCGLSIEYAKGWTGPYKPDIEWQSEHASRQRYKHISQLNSRERILLVPLGTSPMIATQTYTLLQESEDEGRPNIPTVAVVYPEYHAIIENGVDLLEEQFRERGVEFIPFPIKRVEDMDSLENYELYLKTLLTAIETLRTDYPDRSIALSLSGGRKGMSALTLFAAQRTGIEQVYHTLISDIDLEQRIEQETNLDALDELPTDEARARRLFLDEYDREHFQLFSIPVIQLASSSEPTS